MSSANNVSYEFKGIIVIEADLECLTGLHIGGSKESFEIGGIDNPVIKVPKTFELPDKRLIKEGMPYIPGSSLKGKMRSLLEILHGEILKQDRKDENEIGEPCGCGECFVCNIFGRHKAKEGRNPVRLKVEDAYPTEDTLKKWKEEEETLYTEQKTENTINRLTSEANPRKQERVYPGTKFKIRMTYEILNKNLDIQNFQYVLIGMKLLENSYLGGGGSRGNGRVKFRNIHIEYRDKNFYLEGKEKGETIANYSSVDEVKLNELENELKQKVK
jgi:CRISPR-associated protein Csm3